MKLSHNQEASKGLSTRGLDYTHVHPLEPKHMI